MAEERTAAQDRPGGPEPAYAEHPSFGIWPCDNPWHTTHKPLHEPTGECPDCPNRWWASDGTECPEEYALLAEIRWLREQANKGPAQNRDLLLRLIGSLTWADHMGDVSNDVLYVLDKLGIEHPQADEHSDWWPGLRRDLHALGVTTLYGSALYDPADEDEDDE